eukprot:365522-Chlamydomonas_euryale.AAC.20
MAMQWQQGHDGVALRGDSLFRLHARDACLMACCSREGCMHVKRARWRAAAGFRLHARDLCPRACCSREGGGLRGWHSFRTASPRACEAPYSCCAAWHAIGAPTRAECLDGAVLPRP